jgi:hypothetical protein
LVHTAVLNPYDPPGVRCGEMAAQEGQALGFDAVNEHCA